MSVDLTTEALDRKLNDLTVKLFGYFDKRFDEVNENIHKLDQSFDRLQNTLDAFIKRLDNIEADNSARDVQLARLERWVEQIAQKTGIKLDY